MIGNERNAAGRLRSFVVFSKDPSGLLAQWGSLKPFQERDSYAIGQFVAYRSGARSGGVQPSLYAVARRGGASRWYTQPQITAIVLCCTGSIVVRNSRVNYARLVGGLWR